MIITILLIPCILINYIQYIIASMQKITPCLWFDDKSEEGQSFMLPFSKIQRLATLPTMEKKDTRFTEGKRDQC